MGDLGDLDGFGGVLGLRGEVERCRSLFHCLVGFAGVSDRTGVMHKWTRLYKGRREMSNSKLSTLMAGDIASDRQNAGRHTQVRG